MKLTVVGRGTVGCFTVAHFLRWTDWEIDWIYDPNIQPTAVGEGTTLDLPKSLFDSLGFDSNDMEALDSTVKLGIIKRNWGNGNRFVHTFPSGSVGMHFNAVSFQNYVFDRLKHNSRVKLEECSIMPEEIDSDYVIVCTGTPLDFSTTETVESIPVNACWVSQCPWDYARFTYTLTWATKYGWIFGIPLKNRCAIGYLYNSDITDLDNVKKDAEEILKELDLTPSVQRQINFRNYKRKVNFTDRIVYNGNASFFLEPLEATSTGFADKINRNAFDLWENRTSADRCNSFYHDELNNIESMINLHYLAGSVFKNEFWNYASTIAEKRLKSVLSENGKFRDIIWKSLTSKNFYDNLDKDVGSWNIRSFKQNMDGLGIRDKILKMI